MEICDQNCISHGDDLHIALVSSRACESKPTGLQQWIQYTPPLKKPSFEEIVSNYSLLRRIAGGNISAICLL